MSHPCGNRSASAEITLESAGFRVTLAVRVSPTDCGSKLADAPTQYESHEVQALLAQAMPAGLPALQQARAQIEASFLQSWTDLLKKEADMLSRAHPVRKPKR
jgi:hypothetical protein